jgi:hypothetical protein
MHHIPRHALLAVAACLALAFFSLGQTPDQDSTPSSTEPTADLIPIRYTQKEFYRDSLAFHRQELVDTYQNQGQKDPKWDAAALAALDLFAIYQAQDAQKQIAYPVFLETPQITEEQLGAAAQKAIDAGCNDAAILYARALSLFNADHITDGRPWLAKAVAAIDASPYSPFLRYQIAVKQSRQADITPVKWAALAHAQDLCAAMVAQPTLNAAGRREIEQAVQQATLALNHEQYQAALDKLATTKNADPWMIHAITAEVEVLFAWDARGSGNADTVTDEGWQGFRQHLAKAQQAAEAAYHLHPELPEPAVTMITVTAALENAADPDTWFQQALAAQADFPPAYSTRLYFLEPRWGGSTKEMLALGQKALDTARFDTSIPWQYFIAAQYAADPNNGDPIPKIFTRPASYAATAKLLAGYADQWKDTPYADFFRDRLVALHLANGKLKPARQAFEQETHDPDPAAFQLFQLNASNMIQYLCMYTYKDRQKIDQFNEALSTFDYGYAGNILDTALVQTPPAGRALKLFQRLRAAVKTMENYSAGISVSLLDPAAHGFWDITYPYDTADGVIASQGVNPLFLENRLPLPDRHYELHVKFKFLDPLATRSHSFHLSWGLDKGTGWDVGLTASPSHGYIIVPNHGGFSRSSNFPTDAAGENSIDIVYWDLLPSLTVNEKSISLDASNLSTVKAMAPTNYLIVGSNTPVRITQLDLHHLDAKP